MNDNEQDKKYLKDSELRTRKTFKLVTMLLIASGVSFYFEIDWMWKLLAIGAGFFGITAVPEVINVLRLRKKLAGK